MIAGPDYDKLVGIIIENAKVLIDEEGYPKDEAGMDKFHDRLFDRVLTEVDQNHEDLSKYEAPEISEVCSEVESDIHHSDILGL